MRAGNPALKSASSSHSSLPVLILIAIVALLLALYLWLAVFNPEAYFAPYPAIGTRFGEGYSEAAFDALTPGMTDVQVREQLGEPLNDANIVLSVGVDPHPMPPNSILMWSYSDDNPSWFWDAAWLGRYVYFDAEGRVTGTLEWVYYD